MTNEPNLEHSEYSMTGKLEFLSGETVQSFILDMLAVPQEYDVDELEFILEQPQGGARLKVRLINDDSSQFTNIYLGWLPEIGYPH